jgi:MFS family permease
MSQFLFQTPAGYLYDYTESKVLWLSMAAIATTALTIFTAAFAQPYGANLSLMIFVKFLQGAVTSFIPPGLNSITQGIVGAAGMTSQVSTNEMMNHLGTAIIVLTGSIVGVILYPDLGFLFIVSPIACFGFLYFLNRIQLSDIDHAEARGLTSTTKKNEPPSVEPYNPPNETNKVKQDQPSFNFGWKNGGDSTTIPSSGEAKAESPLRVLRDPILLTLYVYIYIFVSWILYRKYVIRFSNCMVHHTLTTIF